MIKAFCETDTVVIKGREAMFVDTELIKKAFALPDEGSTKPSKVSPSTEEIPRKGSKHQIKDVPDLHQRTQMAFYLQNVMFIAKTEDMSAKNYSRLKTVKQGEKINWDALYLDNFKKRTLNAVQTGGAVPQ
ncbi:hypothetical protein GOP47_0013183 [Adiantum capillus-veneris]|uniref:Uncharacterized protein n=1 Tax=Adiantum capillus-veneris TaxID=13818 RepID=A0A9D4UNZ5_ADICA|nr:hypothetical protein GOP47_0013183 [Adiantum capillus-veneris]